MKKTLQIAAIGLIFLITNPLWANVKLKQVEN
jgi:hypothetical protein